MTPPRIESFTARPLVISPDGDGRFDRAKIRYRVSERATVELYVDGIRALRRLGTRTTGTMDWFGVAGGEPLAAGPHTLRLVARDVAGNLGPRSGSRTVRHPLPRARARPRRARRPGERFAILALSQARTLRWRLDGRIGRRASRHAPAPRAARAGPVRARGRRERPRRACRGRRRGRRRRDDRGADRRRRRRRGARRAAPRDRPARPARGPRRLGRVARRPRPLPAPRPQPLPARRGGARRRSSSRSPSRSCSGAGRTRSPSPRSPASRSGSRSTSGATRSTSCCRSTA